MTVTAPEVEQAVAEHPAVAEVAVTGVPDDHWGESVKAIVALRPGQQAAGPETIELTRAPGPLQVPEHRRHHRRAAGLLLLAD